MLKISDLNFFYNNRKIFQNINLELSPGITAILGKNGSGKTTLLKCIAQLLKYRGKILYQETNLQKLSFRKLAKILSFLPAELSSVYDYSVREILEMAIYPAGEIAEKILPEITRMFGLENFLDRPINTLSSGERQLVFLAQVLVQNTPITLLDEPVNYLDVWEKNKFFSILQQIRSQNPEKMFILTTHHIENIFNHVDYFVFLHEQIIKFQGKPKDIFGQKHLEDFRQYNNEVLQTLQNLLKGGNSNVL